MLAYVRTFGISAMSLLAFVHFAPCILVKDVEVAIALQVVDTCLLGVGQTVAVVAAVVFEPEGPLRVVLTEEVSLLILIAGSNWFLQPQLLEIITEIMEEIADSWVVAVA